MIATYPCPQWHRHCLYPF